MRPLQFNRRPQGKMEAQNKKRKIKKTTTKSRSGMEA